MQKASLLAVPAFLFFTGCDLNPTLDQGTAPTGPSNTQQTEWETLPAGRNYLPAGQDSAGNPVYTPVQLLDTMALIEGDIVVASGTAQMEKLRAALVDPKDPAMAALAKSAGFVRTSTYTGGANAWPDGYIPYLIGGGVDRNMIEKAVYEFNQAGSGITYTPYKASDAQGVVFVPSTEQVSSSAVGLTALGQWQGIYIQSGSGVGIIMHEMGHAAGLYHEHARPDRGSYVTITTSGTDKLGMWGRGYATANDGTTVGNYDYNSIMHYTNGKTTFTNPDGTKYSVTLTAKNGQATGNTTMSAGDKVSLWGIPVNQNPWRPISAIGGVAGKITKPYITYYNGAYKRWLLTYDPASGNFNVTAMNDDNSIGGSVQNLNVGAGYNTVLPYVSGSGAPCMLLYSSTTGSVKFYKVIPAGGALGAVISTSSWNTGWTTIEYYEVSNKKYWFFQNASNYIVNIWAITDSGELGPLTFNATWSGWNYFKPFYIETSPAVPSTYFLFRYSSGLTRIRQMTAAGGVGPIIADISLPSYPTVGLWQSVTKAYMAMRNGNSLYIVDFDNTGFRTTGLAFLRVLNTSLSVDRIDAAAIIYSNNLSNNFINNKLYDFKQVVTLKWVGLGNNLFSGLLAPYH